MFIAGYFEFEALNKYSRGAVKKVLICMELKKKRLCNFRCYQHTDVNGNYDEPF